MSLLKQVVTGQIIENHSPGLVDLTLQRIIDNGECADTHHVFTLSYMSHFFKNGLKGANFELEQPTIGFETEPGGGPTGSASINFIKSLTAEEQVSLAQYLLSCIKVGECALYDKSSNVVDWMKYVLRKQD